MATKKIQLTYLWTDESVLLADLTKKISEKMTAWGNTFYQRYGFELDVEPTPLAQKSVARLSKYVLSKRNGVTPDLRDRDDVMEEYDRRIAEWQLQLTAKMAEWDKAADDLHNAVIPSPAFDAALAKVQLINKEYDQIRKQKEKVEAEKDAKREELTGEMELRRQMSVKHKKDSIGSDLRLNVIFCRMAGALSAREPSNVAGQTFLQMNQFRYSLFDLVVLWPYPFVVVDIVDFLPRTVAHELIHAAGHLHPLLILEGMQKRMTHVTIPRGSLMGFPFTDLYIPIETTKTKQVPTGYFDGDANDIMNYTLRDDAGPEVCILSDRDKKFLDSAFFVVP